MQHKEYPKFKYGEVPKLYKKIKDSERKIVDRFITYIKGNAGTTRSEEIKRVVAQFRVVIGVDFSKIDLNLLREYLALLNHSDMTKITKSGIGANVKRFLKWNFKDWSKRFDNLSDIKMRRGFNEEKLNSNTIVTKKEIETIMKSKTVPFVWKTAFITLYESGLRPNELRNLTWSNITLDVDGSGLSEINIFANKTSKARTSFVKESTKYLEELKKRNKDISQLVFPSVKDKSKPMVRNALSMWLSRASRELLGRPIYPYLLRHSRATELYLNAGVPDKIAQKFLGHSKSMSDVYTHLSSKDVKEAVGKSIYNFEDVSPEKKAELEEQIEWLTDITNKQDILIKKLSKRNNEMDTTQKLILQKIKEMK